ncbi:MAG: hypothetical protein P4L33_03340 [Capsulimonadaceae bacterium]|nr:hypothetical protein [Capsulimonadaceae bacterium]
MSDEPTATRRSPSLRDYHEVVTQLADELRGNFHEVGAKLDIVVQKVDDARTRIAVLETQHAEVTQLRQENRDLRCELTSMGKTLTELEVRVKTNAAWISLAISAVLSFATGLVVKYLH